MIAHITERGDFLNDTTVNIGNQKKNPDFDDVDNLIYNPLRTAAIKHTFHNCKYLPSVRRGREV